MSEQRTVPGKCREELSQVVGNAHEKSLVPTRLRCVFDVYSLHAVAGIALRIQNSRERLLTVFR